MTDFLSSSSYACVVLTLVVFAGASSLQKKTKLAILNPILISAVVLMGLTTLLGISNSEYRQGCSFLTYLLTPATICLALGFYQQFQSLKRYLGAVIAGVLAGTVCSIGCIYLACRICGLDQAILLSLLPKSVTAAIGTALTEELGGIVSITTFVIALTGTFGNIIGPALCKLARIQDPIAQGVAFGTSSHVIGTSRAVEMSALAGAVSSLSLTLAGLMTVVFLSFLAQFL